MKAKADGSGHLAWEAVDKYKFIYALIWEYEVRREEADTISISHKRFMTIEKLIPLGPYL
jgi:hypothetical protein